MSVCVCVCVCVRDVQSDRVDLSNIKPSDGTFWRGNFLTTNAGRDDKRSTCFLSGFLGLSSSLWNFSQIILPCWQSPGKIHLFHDNNNNLKNTHIQDIWLKHKRGSVGRFLKLLFLLQQWLKKYWKLLINTRSLKDHGCWSEDFYPAAYCYGHQY